MGIRGGVTRQSQLTRCPSYSLLCYALLSPISPPPAVVSMGQPDADLAKALTDVGIRGVNWDSQPPKALTDMGIRGVTWDDFLKEGEAKPVEPCPSKPEDICTIMYTSGIHVSHLPLAHIFDRVAEELMTLRSQLFPALPIPPSPPPFPLSPLPLQLTTTDIYISYLPLAHIFDRVAEELMTHVGGSIGFWQGVSETQWVGWDATVGVMMRWPIPVPSRRTLFTPSTLLGLPSAPRTGGVTKLLCDIKDRVNRGPPHQVALDPSIPSSLTMPTAASNRGWLIQPLHPLCAPPLPAVISKIESTGGLTKMLFDYAYSSKQARLADATPPSPLHPLLAVVSKIE
ncbi:unnamed protein product [Closterium sp. Yama58-4]|nr:unnamed protein product [Closterium sp. Yama58-4]